MASATGTPESISLRAGGKSVETEEVVGGRQQRRDCVELRQHCDIFVADEIHVVERGGMKLEQWRKLAPA